MVEAEVQSPCIGVCSMDDSTGFCLGCYRAMDEIQQWWDLGNEKKQEIVQKANMREVQMFE